MINPNQAPIQGSYVKSLVCVDFLAKLQMAWEAINKGYDVVFTTQGLDIYLKEARS